MKITILGNFVKEFGYTPQVCEDVADLFEKKGHIVQRGGKKRGKIARSTERAMMSTRKSDVVLIDVFSGKAFWDAYVCGAICHLLKKPYVAVLHGGNLPNMSRKKYVKSFLKNARQVVAPSPYLSAWASKSGRHAVIIRNPLDLSKCTFKKRVCSKGKILWVRRFHKLYNPQLAIQAVAQSKYNVELTMIGPDAGELNACKALAKRLGVAVQFKGFLSREEIDAVAKENDLFLNTSVIDNTPSSLLEAAARGLPIVSTRVGGIPHLFTHEKTALLSDSNAEALASSINRLLEENNLVASLSSQAKKVAKESEMHNVIKRWESLLKC